MQRVNQGRGGKWWTSATPIKDLAEQLHLKGLMELKILTGSMFHQVRVKKDLVEPVDVPGAGDVGLVSTKISVGHMGKGGPAAVLAPDHLGL